MLTILIFMDKLLKINKKYINKKIKAYISAINRFF